ncbi:hypothetical protein [Pararhizobium sp.]|uniref:hypothetical protein n=1 Tax=Pararhizobium sp. TaxID=1977563 RepID=UPI003D1134FD
MFKSDTVFVIGAGASQEFGLPVGSVLMDTIKTNCDFNYQRGTLKSGCVEIFRHYEKIYDTYDDDQVAEFNKRLQASHQIRDGIESADSIDEYIFRYSENPIIAEVGKLQIAYAISLAESDCMLSAKKGFGENSIDSVNHTWIWAFMKALINGVKASEVENIGRTITIICFNYDRCIEHYLEFALMRSFHGMNREEARGIVSSIKIIHPYGSIGDLATFPFGCEDRFARMAENVTTWSETIRDPETVSDMARAIRYARRIVFMGFAFANQNMQLMSANPKEKNYNGPRVYSTGYGLRKETEESLSLNINALYSDGLVESQLQNIHFQYGEKCKEFFDIHRLNLVQ